tara:strand:- start:773 stop:985 length:213 start_codon:yes stop_codon:yes gene_type:complete
MNSNLNEQWFKALVWKLEGERETHIMNVRTLMVNGVGVAEHPDAAITIEGELLKIAECDDKIDTLKKYFN